MTDPNSEINRQISEAPESVEENIESQSERLELTPEQERDGLVSKADAEVSGFKAENEDLRGKFDAETDEDLTALDREAEEARAQLVGDLKSDPRLQGLKEEGQQQWEKLHGSKWEKDGSLSSHYQDATFGKVGHPSTFDTAAEEKFAELHPEDAKRYDDQERVREYASPLDDPIVGQVNSEIQRIANNAWKGRPNGTAADLEREFSRVSFQQWTSFAEKYPEKAAAYAKQDREIARGLRVSEERKTAALAREQAKKTEEVIVEQSQDFPKPNQEVGNEISEDVLAVEPTEDSANSFSYALPAEFEQESKRKESANRERARRRDQEEAALLPEDLAEIKFSVDGTLTKTEQSRKDIRISVEDYKEDSSELDATIFAPEQSGDILELAADELELVESSAEFLEEAEQTGRLRFGPLYHGSTSEGMAVDVQDFSATYPNFMSGTRSENHILVATDSAGNILGIRAAAAEQSDSTSQQEEYSGHIITIKKGRGVATVIESAFIHLLQRKADESGKIIYWKVANQNELDLESLRATGAPTEDKDQEQKRWQALYGVGGKFGFKAMGKDEKDRDSYVKELQPLSSFEKPALANSDSQSDIPQERVQARMEMEAREEKRLSQVSEVYLKADKTGLSAREVRVKPDKKSDLQLQLKKRGAKVIQQMKRALASSPR